MESRLLEEEGGAWRGSGRGLDGQGAGLGGRGGAWRGRGRGLGEQDCHHSSIGMYLGGLD